MGEGQKFFLLKGEETDYDKVNCIRSAISALTNYADDFIIVDFVEDVPPIDSGELFEEDTLLFFQTVKCRDYQSLNHYEVNIRIDGKGANKMYVLYAKKDEVLKLFEEICVRKEIPDLRKWKKFYDSSTQDDWDERERTMTHDRREKIKECEEIVRKWWWEEISGEDFPIYFDALKYIFEKGWTSAVVYQEAYCEELEKMGCDDEIIRLFQDEGHATVLEIIGGKYLYGKGCPLDYRKAYRYLYTAEKLGNLRARYYRALMYKHGLFVKRNYKKYVKLIESIPEEFIAAGGEDTLHVISFAFIELAKIEQEKGNQEKCLEYALKVKSLNEDEFVDAFAVDWMAET